MNTEVITQEELAIVKQAQSVMQTAYDDRVLVKQIADSIAIPDKKKFPQVEVNISDVLTVVRLASSMHLDAVLGGIWAYKDRNNRLVCGVSKKGWQQALHSQPDYQGISFKHIGELKSKKITTREGVTNITYFDACICVIKKSRPDGSIGEFEGVAYFDEEFDGTKPTWISRPKRLLETRALTIAASNAYGWGAYDIEEVERIAGRTLDVEVSEVPAQTHKATAKTRMTKAMSLVNKLDSVEVDETKTLLIEQMKKAVTREELVSIFKNTTAELQKDEDIINLGKQLTSELNTL